MILKTRKVNYIYTFCTESTKINETPAAVNTSLEVQICNFQTRKMCPGLLRVMFYLLRCALLFTIVELFKSKWEKNILITNERSSFSEADTIHIYPEFLFCFFSTTDSLLPWWCHYCLTLTLVTLAV